MLQPGGFAAGYGLRLGNSPYRGAQGGFDHVVVYAYEGEHAYLHGTRTGLKFNADEWRFDAFLRQRYDGYSKDRAPTSVAGMALREPGIDAGFAIRRKTEWGTPYVEVTRDVSDRSEGHELRVGWWDESVRGRWTLRPHVSLSMRDALLNNYYYGVKPSEAIPGRPAYAPGGGADLELALYASYRLTDNWNFFGAAGVLRRSNGVRTSPIVEDHLETSVTFGLMYDFSPQAKRWTPEGQPLLLRAFYGYSSDCKLINIVSLTCTSTHSVDQTDVVGLEVGRTLIKEPNGWPLDLAGYLGGVHHLEKGFQQDFWQFNAYFKVHYWGFPWDRFVRTRLGMGTGLSYAEHIPQSELQDQAKKGKGNWKLLNYLDPTIDFRLGDVIPARALRDTYLGVGVSHRSGMFGKARQYGDVSGGSNYIYTFIETTF